MNNPHENVMLEAALGYARQGWPVFPIMPGAKTPATEHGFHDATVDEAQIRAWWGENPTFNIAFSPHTVGLSIVDLDGPAASTAWDGLGLINGDIPATYEVSTPRPGGRHLYYVGELPPTQSKLADHIDTRGRGSYALLAPSVIDARSGQPPETWGTYRVANDLTPVPVPDWVVSQSNVKRVRAKAATDDLDLPGNVNRAKQYLATTPPAIEGQMGDKRTYVVAADLANLGIAEETALSLMLEIFNPRCVPEWDADELETKIANAYAYAQNEAGSWATEPVERIFDSGVLGGLLAESAARPAPTRRFKPQSIGERRNLPPPSWLIEDMIQDKVVSMIYGPGGGGKTFITLKLALDLAKAGKRICYVMGEGGTGVDQRVAAWEILNDTDADTVPFFIVPEMPTEIDETSMVEFTAELQEFKPDLVIIDTLAWFALGRKENDATDMMRVVWALTTVARENNTAVLAIHHTGQDVSSGPRGSKSFLFGINSALEVSNEAGLLLLHVRRQKDSAARKAPWAFELKDIGPSAVAIPVSAEERRNRTERDDLIGPKRIGAFLREMGAIGEGSGVTSYILAQHAIAHSTDVPEDPEVMQSQVAALASILTRKAKGDRLGAFAHGQDVGEVRWAIPIA